MAGRRSPNPRNKTSVATDAIGILTLTTKTAGDAAERFAEKFLLAQKLKVVARNYRCRFGEIDLIMQDRETLVFVEVRMRASGKFGGAGASIGVAKQQRLIATAQHYLAGLHHTPPCRFDAILMNEMDSASVEWIKDAISA
ncbi:MAG: YraN family protein [Aeromicrobium sp.]|nr:YraN family protein [Burkholderiales bacterium]